MKQCRDMLLIGLQLIEGAAQCGTFTTGSFQFDYRQRQPVDEHHHVWAAFGLACHHRELLHCQPVIVGRLLEVDQPYLARRERTVFRVKLHIRAFGEKPVDTAVLFQQVR